jgi:single-strand DNA-binding protein
MSQGAYVTLVGYVVQDPRISTTATGRQVARVRVATTPRYKDDGTGQWRDGDTSYFDVTCWNRLAEHAGFSLRKGQPVVVKGKIRTSTYEDKNGQTRNSVDITADTVGHDLNRGVASYSRVQSRRPGFEDDRARAESTGHPGDSGVPTDPDEILDEDAIERFGHDLENDELAARAAREHEENDENDETGMAAASAAPF